MCRIFHKHYSVYRKYGMDLRKVPKKFFRGLFLAEDGSELAWFAAEDINAGVWQQDEVHLHMDGTFAVVPKLNASQLFIISAQFEGMVSYILNVSFEY